MLRILQIAPPWFPVPPPRYGGTELVVAGLVDRLVEQGHQVTLLASGGSATRGALQTVYDVPPSKQLGNAVVELPHVLAGYRQRAGFDIIHDHTVVGVGVGALLDGPLLVHTVHGAWTPELNRLYLAVADRVSFVAISHDQAARAPDGLPIAAVVHNGIEVAAYDFRPEGQGYLGWLGRAGPDKGADVAVRVAGHLGLPLRLAVKLNEPDEHAWWHEVVGPLLPYTDTTVTFNATHAQKVELLSGADVVLVPIRWDEPFGLVMIEANACGTPVVAFARGAAPEVVADGRSGVLVPPGDVDAMCGAVLTAQHLDRAACRQHVADHFTTARMADDYLRVYQSVRTARSG